MIKLPEGVEVHVGGQKYVGEIPDKLCPAQYKKTTTVTADEPKKSSGK